MVYIRRCLECGNENPPGMYCPSCGPNRQVPPSGFEGNVGGKSFDVMSAYVASAPGSPSSTYDPIAHLRAASTRAETGSPTDDHATFTLPGPQEKDTLIELAGRMAQQCKLPIDPGQIFAATWVEGKPGKKLTSLGYWRDSRGFWRAMKRHRSDVVDMLRGTHVVTAEYAAYMGWPRETVGETLVHHHIAHGPYAVPLPESWHKRRGVHGVEHDLSGE